MSLQASKHQERAKRPEGKLPQLDPVALDELGMTQAEVEGFAARLHGWVVLPGMKDYPAAAAPHAAPRWPAYPQIIVFCEVASDVALCLELARANARVRRQPVALAPATTTIALGPAEIEAKIAAFKLHTSQQPLFGFFEATIRKRDSLEIFHLANSSKPRHAEAETDLFAGVTE